MSEIDREGEGKGEGRDRRILTRQNERNKGRRNTLLLLGAVRGAERTQKVPSRKGGSSKEGDATPLVETRALAAVFLVQGVNTDHTAFLEDGDKVILDTQMLWRILVELEVFTINNAHYKSVGESFGTDKGSIGAEGDIKHSRKGLEGANAGPNSVNLSLFDILTDLEKDDVFDDSGWHGCVGM